MRPSTSRWPQWQIFLIQLFVLAGLLVSLKLYLPHVARVKAAKRAAEREQKIEFFFTAEVMEDPTREVEVSAEGLPTKRHPQKLRATPAVVEVEAILGIPDISTTDFRGGQHLTWIGTAHQLQASFNKGRLYCLAREDRTDGHGVMVFGSVEAWHPY